MQCGADSYETDRPSQQPLFYDGQTAVFEVWFFDSVSALWFVLTCDPAAAAKQGAIGFHPAHTEAQVLALRNQWRAYIAGGGRGPAIAA